MKRDLSRRHRQRFQADAGQLRLDQLLHDLLGTDLGLRRKLCTQFFGRHVGLDRQYEDRIAEQGLVVDHRKVDADFLVVLEGNLLCAVFENNTQ